MATGITEVTQDASEAGNTLKILSLRLRGAKNGDLEAMGEDTDGLISSVSKLQGKIMELSGVDIMQADGQTFKSTYQIIEEISKVWDKLSDVSQANLLETIAGKNRANTAKALISNWSQVQKAVEFATNAEGSAMEEYSVHMDTIQAHMAMLQSAFQSLSATVMNSDLLKGGLDIATGFLSGIDSIINKIGALNTLLVGAGIVKGIKSFA